jgi:hypothetical protein
MDLTKEETYRLEWLSEEPTRDAPIIAKAIGLIRMYKIYRDSDYALRQRIEELKSQLEKLQSTQAPCVDSTGSLSVSGTEHPQGKPSDA